MTAGVKIQLRRDTSTNWSTVNPVLRSGELGVEIDTGYAKLGDGVTAWATLRYWTPDPYFLALAGGNMTGWLAPAVIRLTDAPTITVNTALGNDFRVTIAASRTMATPTNPHDGQKILFDITQGAGGSFTITWSAGYSFGGSVAPTLSTQAGLTDQVGFKYNADKSLWLFTGALTGY